MKSKKSIFNPTIYELRWECIRRTKEYNEDFNSFHETLERLYGNKDVWSATTYEKEQALFFAEKYGIAYPLDPSISSWFPRKLNAQQCSPKACRMLGKIESVMIDIYMRYRITGAMCLDWDNHPAFAASPYEKVTDYDPLSDKELKSKHSIKIVVDLDAPLYRIKKEVERIVIKWQKLRSGIKPIPRFDTKPKLIECKRHLEVYDLIKDKGWSIEKVAKKYYNDAYKVAHSWNYAKQKVKRDYDMSLKLIDKDGYKKIR